MPLTLGLPPKTTPVISVVKFGVYMQLNHGSTFIVKILSTLDWTPFRVHILAQIVFI